MTPRESVAIVHRSLLRAADVMRRLMGAPDYERYLAHVRAQHPGAEPLTCEEFTRQRLHDQYSRPGSRCC